MEQKEFEHDSVVIHLHATALKPHVMHDSRASPLMMDGSTWLHSPCRCNCSVVAESYQVLHSHDMHAAVRTSVMFHCSVTGLHLQLAAYGKVDCGAEAMQNEILQRGPIVCSIGTDNSFVYEYRNGVYKGPNATDVDHDIEVAPPLHLFHLNYTQIYTDISCLLTVDVTR
jgi:hypothetical protein